MVLSIIQSDSIGIGIEHIQDTVTDQGRCLPILNGIMAYINFSIGISS